MPTAASELQTLLSHCCQLINITTISDKLLSIFNPESKGGCRYSLTQALSCEVLHRDTFFSPFVLKIEIASIGGI